MLVKHKIKTHNRKNTNTTIRPTVNTEGKMQNRCMIKRMVKLKRTHKARLLHVQHK